MNTQNTVQTLIQQFIHTYYNQYPTKDQLNGYPRILTTYITNPNYKEKEQCTLITTENLTHPILEIQKHQKNINTLIINTLTITNHLKKEIRTPQTPKDPIQNTLDQTINTLNLLLKQFINKKKQLKGEIT